MPTPFDFAELGLIATADPAGLFRNIYQVPSDEQAASKGVEVHRARRPECVLLAKDSGYWLRWVLLHWSSQIVGGPALYDVVMCGEGSTGLREPRHTWFGHYDDTSPDPDDDMPGYLFYVAPAQIAWGFGVLSKWFDYEI